MALELDSLKKAITSGRAGLACDIAGVSGGD